MSGWQYMDNFVVVARAVQIYIHMHDTNNVQVWRETFSHLTFSPNWLRLNLKVLAEER